MHVWLWDCWHRSLTLNNSIRRNLMVLNDLGNQFWSPKRERKTTRNVSYSNWIVSLAVWHVASSCWNYILATSILSNFGRKNCVITSRYRAPLTVATWPVLFSKKYGQMMPPAQNPYQTVIRCGCICFSLITRFSKPQTRQF